VLKPGAESHRQKADNPILIGATRLADPALTFEQFERIDSKTRQEDDRLGLGASG